MTLTQLRYLIAIAQVRHFGEAARRCAVSQPTLSMQMQALERSLGVTIFDRRKRPVEPTEAGQEVIAQARRVLNECDRLEGIAHEVRGAVSGTLRLGIIPTLAPYLLPRAAPIFASRHPRVNLRIRELITEQIITELTSGRLDVALTSEHAPDARLVSIALFSEHFVAFVAPEHRLARQRRIPVTALRTEDIWLLSEGHCFRDQVLQLCPAEDARVGAQRSLHFESGNLETLVKLVKQGGGMTLLPYLATLDLNESERRTYLRALVPRPRRDVRLLSRRDDHRRTLLDAFASVMLEAIPRQLSGDPRQGQRVNPGR